MEKGVLINDLFQYDARGAFLFCVQEADNIDIYFLNNVNETLSVDVNTGVRELVHGNINFDALPQSLYFLVEYPLDTLNDGLKFDFNILNEQITGSRYHETIKIKPKSFFTKQAFIIGFNSPIHIIRLFEEFPSINIEQIQYITENRFVDNTDFDNNYVDTSVKINVLGNEKEIDLHVENICPNHAKMESVEILNFQISYFKKELEEALINGLEKLTVCHGIGKGVLKSKIHQILVEMYEVKSFKNEYHHKFGFGSTEIFLK